MDRLKEVNHYVIPLILTNIVQFIISQIAFHYAIGDSSLSLSSISIIQNFLFAFGGILGAFSLAFNIQGARAIADDKMKRFYDLLKSSMILDIVIGLTFMIVTLLFTPYLLHLFYGFEGELLTLSVDYMRMMSPYILLTLLTFLLSNLLKVEKKTKPIFWIGLASSIIDVALNYYLVPIWGIYGAAVSAILSLFIVVIAYFSLVYRTVFNSFRLPSTSKRELVLFGLPLALQECLEGVLFILVFDAFMGRQGLTILSFYAVASQLLSFVRLPCFMYSGAIPIFLPEVEKVKDKKFFLRVTSLQTFLAYVVFSIIVIFFANPFARFLTSQLEGDSIPFVVFTLCAMIFTPFYECSKMFLQSRNQEKWVLKLTTVVNIVGVVMMIITQTLGVQSYYTLYAIYGLTLFILWLQFLRKINAG